MFCFHKKKKNHTALKVIAIVVGVLAAAAGAYVLFTKVLKDKICRKKAAADDCLCDCDCEEIVDEVCDCDCDCTASEEATDAEA